MPNFEKFSLYMLHGITSFNKKEKIKSLCEELSNSFKSKIEEGKSIETSIEEVIVENSWWSSEE